MDSTVPRGEKWLLQLCVPSFNCCSGKRIYKVKPLCKCRTGTETYNSSLDFGQPMQRKCLKAVKEKSFLRWYFCVSLVCLYENVRKYKYVSLSPFLDKILILCSQFCTFFHSIICFPSVSVCRVLPRSFVRAAKHSILWLNCSSITSHL